MNKDVDSIDPNWKAKNITTQWGLAHVRISRNLTVSSMTAIIGRNGREKGEDDYDDLKTEEIPAFSKGKIRKQTSFWSSRRRCL
jgi:hypothetical protein